MFGREKGRRARQAYYMHVLRRSLSDRVVTFACNPSLRHHASYGELRRLTEELLRADADHGDFAAIYRDGAELAFIRCLLDGFGGVLVAKETRAEAFTSYLDAHFDEPLTLADAARHFHLSSEYDSIGLGSLASLNDARLREQVSWLQQRLAFGHVRVGVDFGRYTGGRRLYELENSFDFLVGAGSRLMCCLSMAKSRTCKATSSRSLVPYGISSIAIA